MTKKTTVKEHVKNTKYGRATWSRHARRLKEARDNYAEDMRHEYPPSEHVSGLGDQGDWDREDFDKLASFSADPVEDKNRYMQENYPVEEWGRIDRELEHWNKMMEFVDYSDWYSKVQLKIAFLKAEKVMAWIEFQESKKTFHNEAKMAEAREIYHNILQKDREIAEWDAFYPQMEHEEYLDTVNPLKKKRDFMMRELKELYSYPKNDEIF